MKVEYRQNGNLLFTCDMDVIPRIGDRVVVNTCALSVQDVLWWVGNLLKLIFTPELYVIDYLSNYM